MNRELANLLLFAAAGAFLAAPAAGQEASEGPSISIDAIEARHLLAPVEERQGMAPAYRLDPGPDPVSGQRAKLSLDVGDATVFAITGRLEPRRSSSGPLDPARAKALGQRPSSGKVYGAGISREVGGVDVSATYQYSKISAEQGSDLGETLGDGPGKSHSLRAGIRVRFRP